MVGLPKYEMKPMYIKQNGKIIKVMIREEIREPKKLTEHKKPIFNCKYNNFDECWAAFVPWFRYWCWRFWKWLMRALYRWREWLFWTVILGLLLEPYMEWCAAGIYN